MAITDRGLGRIHKPDHRDRNYLLRAIAPIVAPVRKTKHWPMFYKPLDQGNTGTCVGHGWKHWMLTAPTIRTTPDKEPSAFTIYREACVLDPWPQNDGGDLHFGTAVRAGAKALQARGHIDTYGWAFTIDEVIDWLCNRGPLVIGVDWPEGMFTKDKAGFVHATGRVRGGHCVTLTGWSEELGAVRFPNSWGDWGRAWLSGEDLESLLYQDGEACSAVEVRTEWIGPA